MLSNPNFGILFKELLSNELLSNDESPNSVENHANLRKRLEEELGGRSAQVGSQKSDREKSARTKVGGPQSDKGAKTMVEVGDLGSSLENKEAMVVGYPGSSRENKETIDGGGDLRILIGTMNSAISRGKETVRKKLDDDADERLPQFGQVSVGNPTIGNPTLGNPTLGNPTESVQIPTNEIHVRNPAAVSSLKNKSKSKDVDRNSSRTVRFKSDALKPFKQRVS